METFPQEALRLNQVMTIKNQYGTMSDIKKAMSTLFGRQLVQPKFTWMNGQISPDSFLGSLANIATQDQLDLLSRGLQGNATDLATARMNNIMSQGSSETIDAFKAALDYINKPDVLTKLNEYGGTLPQETSLGVYQWRAPPLTNSQAKTGYNTNIRSFVWATDIVRLSNQLEQEKQQSDQVIAGMADCLRQNLGNSPVIDEIFICMTNLINTIAQRDKIAALLLERLTQQPQKK